MTGKGLFFCLIVLEGEREDNTDEESGGDITHEGIEEDEVDRAA